MYQPIEKDTDVSIYFDPADRKFHGTMFRIMGPGIPREEFEAEGETTFEVLTQFAVVIGDIEIPPNKDEPWKPDV